MLRDFVLALSLANLWFFNAWRLFLISHSTSYPYYHWKTSPAPILLATMFNVVILATILWIGITIARRSKGQFVLRIARGTFLIMFFIAISNILLTLLLSIPWGQLTRSLVDRLGVALPMTPATLRTGLWILLAALSLVLLTVLLHSVVYRRKLLLKLSVVLLLITAPFVLVTFVQAAWQWNTFRSGEHFRARTASTLSQPSKSSKRVLWLIFDELDFRLGFLDRSSTVRLPELDRLRRESVFATNAYPPAGDTILSLPALFTGRLVSKSRLESPNELMLTFADTNQQLPWSTQSSIFSSARQLGFNSGLAGWYHPYCRVIGGSLTRCSRAGGLGFLNDQDIASSLTESDVTVVNSMLRLVTNSLVPGVVQLFIETNNAQAWRTTTLQNYDAIHQQALSMAVDPEVPVVVVHYPIPHPPGIFDRVSQQFSSEPRSGYLDNLELTDRTVSELRRRLEEEELWEDTILLISSDHSLRADRVWRGHPLWSRRMTHEDSSVLNASRDERVPFILKLPQEVRGLNYETTFNTVLSQALLLELLSDKVVNADDVVRWLDSHRSLGESPYVDDK